MSAVGLYTVFWADMFHRVARRTAGAIAVGGAKSLLTKLNRMFRFSRAPFNTSRFGRSIQEVRKHLVESLRKGEAQDLIDMWLGGVARGLCKQEADFSARDLIRTLEGKAGQLTTTLSLFMFK